jgi:hypothetical protein
MSACGDHEAGMNLSWHIDEEAVEAIISGEPVDDRFEPLVAFAHQVRATGDGPCPKPSAELTTLFEGHTSAELGPGARSVTVTLPVGTGRVRRAPATPSARKRRPSIAAVTAKVAGLGLLAKIGLGASIGLGGVAAAGATGVLPEPASNAVRTAIDTISPLELRNSSTEQDRFGDRVSTDATGESDGVPGVHGPDIANEAPGAEHRSPTADDARSQAGEGHRGDNRPAPATPDTAPRASVPNTVPDRPDVSEDPPPARDQGPASGQSPGNPPAGRP